MESIPVWDDMNAIPWCNGSLQWQNLRGQKSEVVKKVKSRFFFSFFFANFRLSGVVMSSQTGMNPCVKWCPTSHPSLGWLFCDLKMVENMLNHQLELFCNKSRPWLAMVWVIPGWDDPHWPTFNMLPMQNIVRPVVAMHKNHVHLELIKFWVLFFRS